MSMEASPDRVVGRPTLRARPQHMTVKVVFTGEESGKQDYNDTEHRAFSYAAGPNGALYIVSGPLHVDQGGEPRVVEVYGPAAWHTARGHQLDLQTLYRILG